MSFLSGIGDFFKGVGKFITGGGIGSTLVTTIVAGYALNRLTKSIRANQTEENANIDKGVKLQIEPSTNNKVPVLYGTAFFGGVITDAEISSNNQTMYYVLTLTERTGSKLSDSSSSNYTFKDVYLNDQRIVFKSDGITLDYVVDRDGNFNTSAEGLVKVYCFDNGSNSPTVPDGYTNSSLDNANAIMPGWTSTDTMTSLVFAIVEVTYNREKGVTGLGDFKFEIENDMNDPGDVLYDYMSNFTYGAGLNTVYIDTSSLTALNTYSLQSVAYDDEGTGAQTLADRYQINGLIDTTKDCLTNIELVCSNAGSWFSWDVFAGKWSVVINQTGTSVASFDDTNIIGDISISGTGLQDLYNSVRVEFPNRDLNDTADFVKIDIADADRNANEMDNTLNISYDLLNEPIQAQLLGLIELKQSRVELLVNFRADYNYLNIKAGELIDITNSNADWTNKVFRVLSINEIHDDTGALYLEFTVIEYDANVYSVADLFRYTRTNANGIVTIGSIGAPGTPQITKFERDSRPRVEIEITAPSQGLVEQLQYWVTNDTTETDDSLRSYRLLTSVLPTGGGVFTAGETVTVSYDALGSQEFYLKVRGINDFTTGPFSPVSGLVDFTPEQVTQGVDDNTSIFDGLGGIATALGMLGLLTGLDGLFSKDTAAGSLFRKIFEGFEDLTGVDLIQDAQDGTIGTGGGQGPLQGPETMDVIAFMPISDPDHFDAAEITSSVFEDIQWNVTGSCYLRLGGGRFQVGGLYVRDAAANFYLYKSDDSLVETVSASSCTIDQDVIVIPFSTRDYGTDYYVTLDEGAFGFCLNDPMISPEIKSPRDAGYVTNDEGSSSLNYWRFNTAYSSDPNKTDIVPLSGNLPSATMLLTNKEFFVNNTSTTNTNDVDVQSDIRLTFNQPVYLGTGNIQIGSQSIDVETAEGLTIKILPGSDNNKVVLNPTVDFTPGSNVSVTIPSTAIRGYCDFYAGTTFSFTTNGPELNVTSGPSGIGPTPSEVEVDFGEQCTVGTGSLYIYDSSDTLIATLPTDDDNIEFFEVD